MHDLSLFRTNLDSIAERLSKRGFTLDIAEFRTLDAERRVAVTETEELKRQRNAESQVISQLRKQGAGTTQKQQQVREMGDPIAVLDEQVRKLDESFRAFLAGIPNIQHESVPAGAGSDDNVEVRRWGQPRTFEFQPKAPWDPGAELGILDLERAATATGSRFAVS